MIYKILMVLMVFVCHQNLYVRFHLTHTDGYLLTIDRVKVHAS